MGTIRLSSDAGLGSSILSNIFIDYYMPEANGDFVKVYLYLQRLQQSNRQISSLSDLADHLNCTDKDVKRAIKYWVSKGLLQYRYDENRKPVGILLCQPRNPEPTGELPRIVDYLKVVRSEEPEMPEPPRTATLSAFAAAEIAETANLPTTTAAGSVKRSAASPLSGSVATEMAETAEDPALSAAAPAPAKKTRIRVQPSAKELAAALEDKYFVDLKVQAEAFFDRPLTQKDINALWVIYKDLGLPFEVCEYLLEYCGDGREEHPERIEPDYYKKIAIAWAEKGVRTEQEAKEATARHFFGTQILRALGIRDRYVPTDDERRMFEDWKTRYCLSEEMLILACETALRRKPRNVSYEYVEGILKDWHAQGLKTPQDVEKFDKKPAKKASRTGTGTSNSQTEFIQGSLSDDLLDMIEKRSIKKAKES